MSKLQNFFSGGFLIFWAVLLMIATANAGDKPERGKTQIWSLHGQGITADQSAYVGGYKQPKDLIDYALGLWARSANRTKFDSNDLPKYAEIEKLVSTALRLYDQELRDNIVLGAEGDNLAYLNRLRNEIYTAVAIEFLIAPAATPAARNAATFVLLTKGRVLDAMTDSMSGLRQNAPKSHAALLDKLRGARSEMAHKALTGTSNSDPEFVTLRGQAEAIEKELITISADFRLETSLISLETLKGQLPEGSALLDIERIPNFDYRGGRWVRDYGIDHRQKDRYFAILLTPRMDAPEVFLLGDADVIDQAVSNFRYLIEDPNSDDVLLSARKLGEVFSNVLSRVGHVERIVVSPDSALNLVPFSALVDKDGRFFVEKYYISYVNSPRDFFRFKRDRVSRNGPLVVGNPDFNFSRSSKMPTSGKSQQPATRSINLSTTSFPDLAATRPEVSAIGKLLNAKVITGSQATETYIKKIRHPSLLHIATHGFFLPDMTDDAQAGDYVANSRGSYVPLNPLDVGDSQENTRRVRSAENPLLRSGLVFAGANFLRGGADDGILTALEAAGLDLFGTQLVVLSACETGVGAVANGEGVFGLRRAFWLAGAQSMVMSLWKVADDATRDLMIEFYRNLTLGMAKTDALRATQLKMLQSKEWKHPFYWASFVQIGDGGPLR